MTNFLSKGLGNIPDIPTVEDYTVADVQNEFPKELLNQLNKVETLPKEVDNRKYCSAIQDQDTLGSCTSQASVSMIESLQKFVYGKYTDYSRLYVYYNTRERMGKQYIGIDSGASNKTTLKAIVKRGLIPESDMPYVINNFKQEPSAMNYRDSVEYGLLKYVRVDSEPVYNAALVDKIKSFLSTGYNIFTGCAVYNSIYNLDRRNSVLPYPSKTDKSIGGHAFLLVGYANDINTNVGQGAFLVQNSWGTDHGDRGFFWIPTKYFETGVAYDNWTATSGKFLDEGVFR